MSADVDLGRLVADRMRTTSFVDCMDDHRTALTYRRVDRDARAAGRRGARCGAPSRASRSSPATRPSAPSGARRCTSSSAPASRTRLPRHRDRKVVIGVSGGVDSTQALLVAVGCMDELGLPRANVLGVHDAGLRDERADAAQRAPADGGASASAREEIDIKPAAMQMLHDLRHRAATGARRL